MTGIPFDDLADLPGHVLDLYDQVLDEMYPQKGA